MIEVIETDERLSADTHYYQIIIDGVPLESDKGSAFHARDILFMRVDDYDAIENICLKQICDLPKGKVELTLECSLEQLDSVGDITIHKEDESHGCKISFRIRFDYENWKQLWSIVEYMEEFKQTVEAKATPLISFDVEDKEMPSAGFSVHFHVDSLKNIIDEEIEQKGGILEELHEETVLSLRSKATSASIALAFDFPDEVRVPCEQYLLYFGQFLKDLGVEANTALTHEAGQVLFTVTPDDKQQALDKIRIALDTYLHLPSSPVTDIQQSEIEILRLSSQLQHFQSQLSLARAEIQMKEAAIQLQRTNIAQLSGEVIMDSMKNITPQAKSEEKEELIKDILAVSKFEKGGFQVNLAEVVRQLKRLFKKEG